MMRARSNCVAAAVFSMAAFARGETAVPNPTSDLARVQANVRHIVLGAPTDHAATLPKTVEDDLKTLRADGSWPDQDYADTDPSHWKAEAHLSRLERITRAYYQRGQVDEKTRTLIVTSLAFWLAHDPHNVNWWFNEIGVPRGVGVILILLGDDAPADLKQHGIALMQRANWKRQTGANLLDETWIQVMRGCLSGDMDVINEAFARSWQEMRVVDRDQEGIQADGTFHQHGPMLYNQSYGGVYVQAALHLLQAAKGTSIRPAADAMDALDRMLLDGDLWMTRGWVWDFGACGRAITRPGMTRDALQKPLENIAAFATPRSAEMQAIAKQRAATGDTAGPIGNRQFWCSDYMVQRRAGFLASFRMYSDRTANTDELTNGENRLSHHIADGATCLMVTGQEYFDIYPVWDWMRIPGTTIAQGGAQSPKTIKRKGKTDFVGGVSDGTNGCCAMDFSYNALHARKAWFCFDDRIVCLGTGIACDTDHAVLTTLNQCLLNGPVYRDGTPEPLATGEQKLQTTHWLWHGQIGYVFPQATDLSLKIGPQHGAWSDIGVHSPDPVSRDVFNAVIDHGSRPTNSGYAYMLLPGADADQTAKESEHPTIKILSNTPTLQVVRSKAAGAIQAVFYEPGDLTVGTTTIHVDHACMLMLTPTDNAASLAVACPTAGVTSLAVSIKTASDSASLSIDLPAGRGLGKSVVRSITTRVR